MTTNYDARIDWNFIRGKEGDWSVGYVPNIKNRRGVIKSGTTVLFGFDLGQHDLPELKELHLNSGLESKLAPYLGAKGADAVMAPQRRLEGALDSLIAINNAQTGIRIAPVGTMRTTGVVNQPNVPAKPGQTPRQFVAPQTTVLRLELSIAERQELTRAIQKHFYERLRTHYDAHRKGRSFSQLPVRIQTALLSLSWQTGNIWSGRHPAYSLFKEALQEHWAPVVTALRGGPLVTHASSADAARRRAEGRLIDAAIGAFVTPAPTVVKTVIP
jgi:hypothetical protein